MVRKTKLFALPKFGSLQGRTSASLKISEIFAIRKDLASFETGGCINTYTNKIGFNATPAYVRAFHMISP